MRSNAVRENCCYLSMGSIISIHLATYLQAYEVDWNKQLMNGGSWYNRYKYQRYFEIWKVICMSDYTNSLPVWVRPHNRINLTIRWTAHPKLHIDFDCVVMDTATFYVVWCSRKSGLQCRCGERWSPIFKLSINLCINPRHVIAHKLSVDIFMFYVTLQKPCIMLSRPARKFSRNLTLPVYHFSIQTNFNQARCSYSTQATK